MSSTWGQVRLGLSALLLGFMILFGSIALDSHRYGDYYEPLPCASEMDEIYYHSPVRGLLYDLFGQPTDPDHMDGLDEAVDMVASMFDPDI